MASSQLPIGFLRVSCAFNDRLRDPLLPSIEGHMLYPPNLKSRIQYCKLLLRWRKGAGFTMMPFNFTHVNTSTLHRVAQEVAWF